jgi:probable selenium-dependent hydroxylase accessory protein YqeC
MIFSSLVHLEKGSIVAVIGGGGKSGLIELLESELTAAGRPCLVTVTTRLGKDQFPDLTRVQANTLDQAIHAARISLSGQRILLMGPNSPDVLTISKISRIPPDWIQPTNQATGANLIWLIEADGSARRPIKAHRDDEPVLPPRPYFLILVIGLSALLFPWTETIHRPEIFQKLQPLPESERPLTVKEIISFAAKAYQPLSPDLIFLNQADSLPKELAQSEKRLALGLTRSGFRVVGGSLFTRTFYDYQSPRSA